MRIANRIGLVNTMVFTHLPANVLLMLIPFVPDLAWVIALLLVRSALSQMDVPTRSSYVMAVVSPAERAAAASITSVPRSLASAASPLLAGYLLERVELRLAAGDRRRVKIVYDLLLLACFARCVRRRRDASELHHRYAALRNITAASCAHSCRRSSEIAASVSSMMAHAQSGNAEGGNCAPSLR